MKLGIKNSQAYFDILTRTVQELDSEVVDQIATELLGAYYRDRTVFVFGNGGSAATASHFACDMAKGATKWLNASAKRFRVVALTDNVPLMTAWANDAAYEDIFAEQLRNLVRADDVVIAISGSGNSPNILNALAIAQQMGARTVGMTGFIGGKMISLCRQCVVVPSDNMEVIEDLHLAVCHSLSTVVRAALSEFRGDGVQAHSFRAMAESDIAVCSDSRTKTTTVFEMPDSRLALNEFGRASDRGKQHAFRDHVDVD